MLYSNNQLIKLLKKKFQLIQDIWINWLYVFVNTLKYVKHTNYTNYKTH